MGLGLRLGEIRESGETGDSREEEDTQWRQVITLYTRILRQFADSAYFVSLTLSSNQYYTSKKKFSGN